MARLKKEENIAKTISRLGVESNDGGSVLRDDEATEAAERLDQAASLGPLEDGEDADDNPIEISAPPPSRLRQTLFEKTTERRPPPVASREPIPIRPAPEAPIAQAPLAYTESLHVPAPSAERVAARKKAEIPPSLRKFGSSFAKKLPGAEKVKISKRDPQNGQLGYIGEYQARDLMACSDAETFIHRYIRPTYGAGEYQISVIDGSGNALELAPVVLLEAPKETAESGVVGLMRNMIDGVQQKQRELESRVPDPIGMLKGVMDISERVQARNAPPANTNPAPAAAGEGMLAAVLQAMSAQSNTMMQMMMQQQQAQQAQQQAQLAAQREDNKMFLQMLMGGSSGKSDPLPPMPPAPPPFSLKEMAELAVLLIPLLKGTDDTKQLLMAMLNDAKSQALSPRDTIELIKEMRPASSGSDDFRKSIENMSMIMQVAQNLRANSEPQGAGFFDAIGALLSNGDFLGSIGTAIRKRAESAALSEQVKARTQLAETARRMGYRQPPAIPADQQVDQRVQQPATPAASAPAQPAPARQQRPQQQQAPQQQPQFPPLPDNIGDFITQMDKARVSEDQYAAIQGTMDMLMSLGGYNEWRPFVEKLFTIATTEEGPEAKKKALGMLAMLFRHLNALGILSKELGEYVFLAFEKHYDNLIASLKGAPAPAPDPAVDPFGAVLAATETPEDEDEEEDEEADEDEEDEVSGDEDDEGEDEGEDEDEGIEDEEPEDGE